MTDGTGRLALVRSALRNGRLRRVLAAYLFFNISELAAWVALLVWAYQEWGVGGASGVSLVQLVPAALLAAPSAAWLGGYSRFGVLRLGYAAQAVAHTAPGALILVGAPSWLVVIAAVASGVTVSMSRPAHNAVLPDVSRTTADLTTANAASGALEAVAAFVGPALAGLALAQLGAGEALVGCGVLMALATLLCPRGRSSQTVSDRDLGIVRPGAHLRSVLVSPDARVLSILSLAEFTLIGLSDILLVVLALDVLGLGNGGPGILTAALGIGGVLGSGLTFVLIGRPRMAAAVLVGAAGAGLAFGLAGAADGLAVAMVAVAACGAFHVLFDVASRTLAQRLLPDQLLAAMFGVRESVMMAGYALGSLAAPILVSLAGSRGAFVVAGACLPVVSLALLRSIVRLDRRTSVPEDVLALLDGVPSLRLLAPRVRERLAIDASAVDVPAGESVVTEGEPGDLFYVIARGTLEVRMGGEPVRTLGPGQWFGELALLRSSPRTATVTAQSPCRLWAIGRESFLGAVGRSTESLGAAEAHARDTYCA